MGNWLAQLAREKVLVSILTPNHPDDQGFILLYFDDGTEVKAREYDLGEEIAFNTSPETVH